MDCIPDYTELHAAYEAERERKLDKFPKCDCCGEPITDDYLYKIDGEFLCEECLNNKYREDTDDYIKD